MRTRPLGSTGLNVTPVGLGLAAVGRPAYIDLSRQGDLGADRSVDAMEGRSHELLDAARDGGVGYFDAARSYGRAEAFLSSWLRRREIPPGAVTVGSKWGYRYTAGWRMDAEVHEVKDHSLAMLRGQLVESRALLGDWLNLYQIHSATLESGVLDDREVLAELAEMRAGGLAIGLSVSGPRQAEVIRRAMEVEVDGANPFGTVQATWNVLEPSTGPALVEASGAGWGVIVKESLANGRLTPRASGPHRAVLERVAKGCEATVDQVAMAAVLRNPWVGVVLSGAVTVGQLRSNLGALSIDLQPAEVEQLTALAESPDRYWRIRAALPWS